MKDLSKSLSFSYDAPVAIDPAGESQVLFEFDRHRIDPIRRELSRDGTPVEVEPRVFDLLLHLIENRHRLVDKDDLIARVWGGRIVSDSALTKAINTARKAIGDDGRAQRLIRTSSRRGYALSAMSRFTQGLSLHRRQTVRQIQQMGRLSRRPRNRRLQSFLFTAWATILNRNTSPRV
jgi:DNA-binding winged helix-turn-helix (wHTH) protein